MIIETGTVSQFWAENAQMSQSGKNNRDKSTSRFNSQKNVGGVQQLEPATRPLWVTSSNIELQVFHFNWALTLLRQQYAYG